MMLEAEGRSEKDMGMKVEEQKPQKHMQLHKWEAYYVAQR